MNDQSKTPEKTPLTTPSLMRRLACWLYEGVLLFGVVFMAGYLFSTLTQTRHALENRHAQQAFIFLVLGAYFVWFWMKGQTLAMKTWHIRVVDVAGNPLTFARALLRYILSWIWFFPPLLASYLCGLPATESAVLSIGWVAVWTTLARFQPQAQFWHDIWAGTRLVQQQPSHDRQPLTTSQR